MDAHHLISLKPNPNIPDFRPGDTVRVDFRILEGTRERIQAFNGVVIRRRGGGPATTFTVRNVTRGYGVERIFPLFSPQIDSVVITRFGKVRRARLYYQRNRFGRAARIKEGRPRGVNSVVAVKELIEEQVTEISASRADEIEMVTNKVEAPTEEAQTVVEAEAPTEKKEDPQP